MRPNALFALLQPAVVEHLLRSTIERLSGSADSWVIEIGKVLTSVGGLLTSVGGLLTSVGSLLTSVGSLLTSVVVC